MVSDAPHEGGLSAIDTHIHRYRADSQVLDALEEVQARLCRGEGGRAGRWVKRHNIHLTLKFLGQVPSEQLEAVYRAVAQACEGRPPFVLTVTDLHCLPDLRRPRVICVGVQEETGELVRLHEAVERELGQLGFPAERRRFRPHLTLGRVRKQAARQQVATLAKSVAAYEVSDRVQMRVDGVSVVRSELTPEGPLYTRLFEAPLGEGETD